MVVSSVNKLDRSTMIDGFEVMQMIFQVILLTALGQSSAVAKLKPAISPNLRMVFISHTWCHLLSGKLYPWLPGSARCRGGSFEKIKTGYN